MPRQLIAAAALLILTGTMPAAGGYSTKPTVGIVTQVEGAAFIVSTGETKARELRIGLGLTEGDRFWVESRGLVRLTDTQGNRVTVAGPATIGLKKRGQVYVSRGSVKFKSADSQAVSFESALVNGSVDGEAAIWVSPELVQMLGLSGDVKAWHPELASSPVSLAPGYFAESLNNSQHLQPKRPARADESRFAAFLERFEKSAEDRFDPHAVVPARALASAPAVTPTVRGSRKPVDVIEPVSEQSQEWLQAHIAGKDIDDPDDEPLRAPGAKLDAYGRPIRSRVAFRSGRSPASDSESPGPSIEIVKTGKKHGESFKLQKTLIKKLERIRAD